MLRCLASALVLVVLLDTTTSKTVSPGTLQELVDSVNSAPRGDVLPVPMPSNGNIPEQIHISFAGRDQNGYPNTMSVSWYTYNNISSTVQYGMSALALTMESTNPAPPQSYLPKSGFHHHVLLQPLNSGVRYYYRVGSLEDEVWSSIFSFVAPVSDAEHTYNVQIFGDMGYLSSKQRPLVIPAVAGLEENWSAIGTRQQMERFKNENMTDWVFHIGDIGYVDDAFAHSFEFSYERVYNDYVNWIQNVSATLPYMVLVGNHESECHGLWCSVLDKGLGKTLGNFTAYNSRWSMPSSESDGVSNMWYSFNYGPIHFVAINTETDFEGAGEENHGDSGEFPAGHFAPNGTYLKWLQADLEQANAERDVRPWIVVCGHRPFPEISHHANFQQLFDDNSVDMYFSGHTHSYLRSFPTRNNAVDRSGAVSKNHYSSVNGTTFIVVGGAGCDEMKYKITNSTTTSVGSDLPNPYKSSMIPLASMVPMGSEVQSTFIDEMATGILSVVNRSALHWQLYSSHSGEVIDHVWLTK